MYVFTYILYCFEVVRNSMYIKYECESSMNYFNTCIEKKSICLYIRDFLEFPISNF